MPLTYRDRHSTSTQLDVLSGALVIGSINKGSLSLSASRETPWAWHFRVHVAPLGFVMHGVSDARRGEGGYGTELAAVDRGGRAPRCLAAIVDPNRRRNNRGTICRVKN